MSSKSGSIVFSTEQWNKNFGLMENVMTDYERKLMGNDACEGKVAKGIEKVTAKVPSDVYLCGLP